MYLKLKIKKERTETTFSSRVHARILAQGLDASEKEKKTI
jgi:hypothetical protein